MTAFHLLLTHILAMALTALAFVMKHRAQVAKLLDATAKAIMAPPGTSAAGYFQAIAEGAGVPHELAVLASDALPGADRPKPAPAPVPAPVHPFQTAPIEGLAAS